jgi:hypothetical protein
MGKWDGIVEGLPKFPVELTDGGRDYQGHVEKAKLQIPLDERTSSALARRWIRLRKIEDRLEERAKKIRLHMRACEQMMTDAFEAEQLRKLELAEGGSITKQPEPYAYVTDREKFREWCVAQGLTPLMTLSWQTTNSLVKERLEHAEAVPPGVDVFSKDKFVLRK